MKLSQNAQLRKSLLPKWIRFFCWIFLVFGFFGTFISLLGSIFAVGGNMNLYGLYYSGSGLNIYALIFIIMFFVLGLSSYGLLWGKKWGINIGILQGVIGIIMPLITTIWSFKFGVFRAPLELILFIPWVIIMFKIKNQWLSQNVPQNPNNTNNIKTSQESSKF